MIDDISMLRSFIREVLNKKLLEEKNKEILGEPDSSTEKHRDEPEPQYDVEEDRAESEDHDEASTVGGMGSGLGPAGPLTYDPEKPVYNPYNKEK